MNVQCERHILLNSNYIVLVNYLVPTLLHRMSNLSMLTNQASQDFIKKKKKMVKGSHRKNITKSGKSPQFS